MAIIAAIGRLAALGGAALVLACSGAGSSADASDSTLALTAVSTWPAGDGTRRTAPHPAPETPARDADQVFLRRMLDHHETVVAYAHAAMMSEAGHGEHGGSVDPAEFDAVLDRDKFGMLALLDSIYGEKYSPHPQDTTGLDFAARLRAGVTLVEDNLPRLRRREVRTIARRIRATHLQLLAQLDSVAGEAKH